MSRPHRWPLPLWRRLRWRVLMEFAVVLASAAALMRLLLMLLGNST